MEILVQRGTEYRCGGMVASRCTKKKKKKEGHVRRKINERVVRFIT